jgi:hypothetical protein
MWSIGDHHSSGYELLISLKKIFVSDVRDERQHSTLFFVLAGALTFILTITMLLFLSARYRTASP